jgi:hypothetical protein
MPQSSAERARAYRQRIRAAGGEDLLIRLPSEVVAYLDQIKVRRGLRNRSAVLLEIIEQRRQPPSI